MTMCSLSDIPSSSGGTSGVTLMINGDMDALSFILEGEALKRKEIKRQNSMVYCKNQYGIPVKKWCVTCQKRTKCKHKGAEIDINNCWVMKDAYQNAGKGDGRVRKLVTSALRIGDTETVRVLKFVDFKGEIE